MIRVRTCYGSGVDVFMVECRMLDLVESGMSIRSGAMSREVNREGNRKDKRQPPIVIAVTGDTEIVVEG